MNKENKKQRKIVNDENKDRTGTCILSDYVARQVLEMAREFYSHPENVKKYQEWYEKEYGLPPRDFPKE